MAKKYKSDLDKYGTTEQGFNVVCTTYRLTEHYHYWMKNNPMNVQLVPEPFVEVPAQLADEMGIHGGEKVGAVAVFFHRIFYGPKAPQSDALPFVEETRPADEVEAGRKEEP